jgi:hypothetical protein
MTLERMHMFAAKASCFALSERHADAVRYAKTRTSWYRDGNRYYIPKYPWVLGPIGWLTKICHTQHLVRKKLPKLGQKYLP